MLLYHVKQLFGKSVDNPSLLAQTVLGIMLICLNGGPNFLTKLIPISKLTSAFLFKQTELTVQAITFVPADVKAIIYDCNRVNQAFFKVMSYTSGKNLSQLKMINICFWIMFIC